MNVMTRPIAVKSAPVVVNSDEVRLGKDVLELVSTAMYVDPLVVYREYVQNAADSLDEARSAGLLAPDGGLISIRIDPQARSVAIRDDGAALSSDAFVSRMLALGGSVKRGSRARGFRGVGRLAGLGHAQELIFRSRADGEADVTQLLWDGRRLRAILADPAFEGELAQAIAGAVSVTRRPPLENEPARFFEVELVRIPRGRSDKLLAVEDVKDYLSQIAPVPFREDFTHGAAIADALKVHGGFSEFEIRINDLPALRRPHRDAVMIGSSESRFDAPVFTVIPHHDGGGAAAVAWFLHHGYEGALTTGTLVKGLRLRAGNLQVGDSTILEGLFAEARFNGWSVGEVHLFDGRLSPNGRRDQLEHNVHYSNLVSHLAPHSRDISNRCRTYSARRSRLRALDAIEADIIEQLTALTQGGLSDAGRSQRLAVAEAGLQKFRTALVSPRLVDDLPKLNERTARLESQIAEAANYEVAKDPLSRLPPSQREFFGRMIDIIYAYSTNQVAAKSLVDRVLQSEVPKHIA